MLWIDTRPTYSLRVLVPGCKQMVAAAQALGKTWLRWLPQAVCDQVEGRAAEVPRPNRGSSQGVGPDEDEAHEEVTEVVEATVGCHANLG
jgi:hypothetical protein